MLRRFFANRGRVRPGMAPGCHEKLDADFLWWILSFRLARRPGVRRLLAQLNADQRAIVLCTPREVEDFVASLGVPVSAS